VMPSSHAGFSLRIGLVGQRHPFRVHMIAHRQACVRHLKDDLQAFCESHYSVEVPPDAQLWSEPDESTVLSLSNHKDGVGVQLTQSCNEALALARSTRQAKQKAMALKSILESGGLEDKSIDEFRAELENLGTVRKQLTSGLVSPPLPDELAALCTTDAVFTEKQRALLRLASSLYIIDASQSFAATGISSHAKEIITFSFGAIESEGSDDAADVAMFEWKVDSGDIDGFSYLRAELTHRGEAVLQYDFDEDRSINVMAWTSPGGVIPAAFSLSSGPLDADALYACLECVLPLSARPGRHGFKPSAKPGQAEPLFTEAKPLRVDYSRMASTWHCSARPQAQLKCTASGDRPPRSLDGSSMPSPLHPPLMPSRGAVEEATRAPQCCLLQ